MSALPLLFVGLMIFSSSFESSLSFRRNFLTPSTYYRNLEVTRFSSHLKAGKQDLFSG